MLGHIAKTVNILPVKTSHFQWHLLVQILHYLRRFVDSGTAFPRQEQADYQSPPQPPATLAQVSRIHSRLRNLVCFNLVKCPASLEV